MTKTSTTDKSQEDTPKPPKDKNCPFCGQAFTSSSLGRHLDLYIKEHNPKRHDGVHNVEEIRRLRGAITRRNLKGSKRHNSATPSGTPTAANRTGAFLGGPLNAPSSVTRDAAGFPVNASAADIASKYSIGGVRWEATGVMNEVLYASPGGANGANAGAHERLPHMGGMNARDFNGEYHPVPPHYGPRHYDPTPFEVKQRLQGALDDARAAELALREFIAAWRAAKQQIEMGSMPFDFDPLAMNFPALTLRCLRVQPTLFASTPLPTTASWSTTPPGASQFEALKDYFREEFRKWRVKCAVATTAQFDDIRYPPAPQFQQVDRQEAIERAEQSAIALEEEAGKHLELAYRTWDELSDEQKKEVWILELARGIATKQSEIDKLREERTYLRQEASNYKNQIEQLNRLQQPREYRLAPPAHIPMDEKILFELQDAAVSQGGRAIGLNINDRHSDLNGIVTSAIGRWKNIVVSGRASGTGVAVQGPLGPPGPPPGPGVFTAPVPPPAHSSAIPPGGAGHYHAQRMPIISPPVTVAAPTPMPDNSATRSQKQDRQTPRTPAQSQPTFEGALPESTAIPSAHSTNLSSLALDGGPVPSIQASDVSAGHDVLDNTTNNNSGNKDEGNVDDEDDEIEKGKDINSDAALSDKMAQVAAIEVVASGVSTEARTGTTVDNSSNDADDADEADEADDADDADDDGDKDDEDDRDDEEASEKDTDTEMEDGDGSLHVHTPMSRAASVMSE
ncbi:hypothetical protein SEPCBS119000_002344 [Sporothrix epigloea]|uniref:Uncharacterized protein n=1 Tax=Sporothrix epigloea TaxID=1892477 RepID=A0ABP0DIG5_9PEZI